MKILTEGPCSNETLEYKSNNKRYWGPRYGVISPITCRPILGGDLVSDFLYSGGPRVDGPLGTRRVVNRGRITDRI